MDIENYTRFEDDAIKSLEDYSMYLQDVYAGFNAEYYDSTNPDIVQAMDQCKILQFQVSETLRQMRGYHNIPMPHKDNDDGSIPW